MGASKAVTTAVPVLLALLAAGTGCQTTAPVTNRRLIEHQAMIDFSGLKPAEPVDAVKASCSVPRQWEVMPLKKTGLYAHQQWKSPSTHTGVGVVYIRLPFPIGERTLLWFAKREYTSASNDGKVIGQWTDDLGREWFEAQNNKYHVRGYAKTQGNDAWIVYSGWRVTNDPQPAEIALARRSLESIVPAN